MNIRTVGSAIAVLLAGLSGCANGDDSAGADRDAPVEETTPAEADDADDQTLADQEPEVAELDGGDESPPAEPGGELTDITDAFSACGVAGHPGWITGHAEAVQPDHCAVETPPEFVVLTNWGTKPEWLGASDFVFLSDLMGDVFRMDLVTGSIENLTDHFVHAGFTRVHVLANSDLLLVGRLDGPPPDDDLLNPHSPNMFESEMFVLAAPFDGDPIALEAPAWEGVAVSRTSNLIGWSTSRAPFWVADDTGAIDLAPSAEVYLNAPSELWVGDIVYDADGTPSLANRRMVLSKAEVGAVLLEPQDFVGPDDMLLLASAYGPAGNGGDALIVDVVNGGYEQVVGPVGGYEEFEGVAADGTHAFIEIDPDADFSPGYVDLLFYGFRSGEFTELHTVAEGPLHIPALPHEPVLSESGRWALTTTAAWSGWPGYGMGVALWDIDAAVTRSAAVGLE